MEADTQFNGVYPASATGSGPSPAVIAATQLASFSQWPPTSMGPSFGAAQIALFPTLTKTGVPITLPTPTDYSTATAAVGSGWQYSADKTSAYVYVAGCAYPP